jgi:hypothetical protein
MVAVSSPVTNLYPGVVQMSWNRRFATLALTLALVAGVSCTAADTTSPDQPSQLLGTLTDATNNLLGGTVQGVLGLTDLLTCSPQPYASTTKVIDRDGGEIRVGSHVLVIPRDALRKKTTITAEQMRGSTNSVRFSPEGLRFEKSAQLTMSYDNCILVLLPKKIVYTSETFSILELLKSTDIFKSKTVKAGIDHFSRYAVAY